MSDAEKEFVKRVCSVFNVTLPFSLFARAMFLLEMASILYVSQPDRLHSFILFYLKADYVQMQ